VGTALPSRPLVQTSSDIKQQLETAKTHFSEEAELAGLLGSDGDNLKDAIQGDSYEVETRYRDFAQQARDAGDKAAANCFEEIRHDEMKTS
jgi:rubrerythrin